MRYRVVTTPLKTYIATYREKLSILIYTISYHLDVVKSKRFLIE